MEDYEKAEMDKLSKEENKAYGGNYEYYQQAKSDVHTIVEYSEIMDNPDRKKRAAVCAKAKMKGLKGIAGSDKKSNDSEGY